MEKEEPEGERGDEEGEWHSAGSPPTPPGDFLHYVYGDNIFSTSERKMAHRAAYKALCSFGDRVVYPVLPSVAQKAWNHEAGPKTVFFWAPTIKWALVIAGLADLARPANKLSVYQNSALTATGLIWTRYCLVITPINYYLSSVNFFVGCTGLAQLARIAHYRYTNPDWEEKQ